MPLKPWEQQWHPQVCRNNQDECNKAKDQTDEPEGNPCILIDPFTGTGGKDGYQYMHKGASHHGNYKLGNGEACKKGICFNACAQFGKQVPLEEKGSYNVCAGKEAQINPLFCLSV